jgi:hypothetical protein
MRHLSLLTVGVLLIVASGNVEAGVISPAGLGRIDDPSSIQLVQDKKSEPLKQKAKRIWRNLAGYKFDVACFPFIAAQTTCTDTGKNREAARAKCQSRHQLCRITDARR